MWPGSAKLHSPLSAKAFIIPVQMSSLRPEKPHKLHVFKNYKMQGRRDASVGKGAVTPDDLSLIRGPTEWKGALNFQPSSHPHVCHGVWMPCPHIGTAK